MTPTKTVVVEVMSPPMKGRRRTYTTAQKQALLSEAERPGSSVSAVARRHGLSPTRLFRWRNMRGAGALQGLQANEPVVPESEARALRERVRELERLLGKKTMEPEILKEAVDIARQKEFLLRSGTPKQGRFPAIARTLGVNRSHLQVRLHGDSGQEAARPKNDAGVLERIRTLLGTKATFGYRRVAAVLRPSLVVNHRRVYRIMKENQLLLPRYPGRPNRSHDGKIATFKSNMRWCSDGFEIRYWNAERVQVAFNLLVKQRLSGGGAVPK